MSNRLRMSAALLATALGLAATPMAFAETAEDILGAAMGRYEKRLASIESVTIVQEVMGMEQTLHLRKEMVDGHPVLVPSGTGQADDPGSVYRQLGSMAKSGTVEGKEAVDGHTCWVVHVTDLGGMSVAGEASDDFEAKDGTLYVDADDLVLRRMLMNGVAKKDGEKTPVTMDMLMKDYRETDGWLYPFRTEMSLGGAGGAEAPEAAEMREAMAQMKEELAKMPADQRQMMEKMMKDRMPDLEKMAESGKLAVTVTVKEVRVNEAPE